MRTATSFVLTIVLTAALLLPLGAQDFDPFTEGGAPALPESKVEFLSEAATIAPGTPFSVAINLTHPDHWHSYYVNPGTVGLSLDPSFELPEGFKVERVAWPTPERGKTAGQNTYGYEHTVYHLFTVTPPGTIEAGKTVTLTASPSWQICDDKNCVLEPSPADDGTHTLEIPVAAEPQLNPANAESFQAARAMLPKALPESLTVQASKGSGSVTVLLTPASAVPEGPLHIYDRDGHLDAQAKPAVERGDDGVRWTLALKKEEGTPAPKRLTGILAIGDAGYKLDVEYTRAPSKPVSFGTLLAVLGGMFLGGMILNLMPCVFPVIGLKIMGFVQQAGEDRKKIAMHGVIFAVGVLLSFWVLSGLLLALREGALGSGSGDQEVSWGYQLQNPWIVWGIMLVMFALALNMFGVFEIGTSATSVGGNLVRKQGASGTFFSGILATVVATPCSAPFLGAAMGATFALPPALFMLSFTAMALGLAFPYLLLSLFPKLVEKLPRPGPWMESFKQSMSFLLFATAGFLLWVYVTQIDVSNMLNVVIGLTALAIAGWIYGRWCVISRAKRTRLVGAICAVIFAAVGFATTKPPKKDKLVWEPWSQATVESALEEGRPVYVDFTAAWCATCQVNKKTAYTEPVQELFNAHNVLLLKADNTGRRPEIDTAIRELGRAAVPVNVLYVPDVEEPHLTTEIFTAGYMVEFLNKHLGEAPEK